MHCAGNEDIDFTLELVLAVVEDTVGRFRVAGKFEIVNDWDRRRRYVF